VSRLKQIILLFLITLVGGLLAIAHLTTIVEANTLELREGTNVVSSVHYSSTGNVNLLRIPLSCLADSLLCEYPQYESVRCRFDFNGNVVCDAERVRPVALISAPEVYGLTSRAELVPAVEIGESTHLPLITGLKIGKAKAYHTVNSRGVRSSLELLEAIEDFDPELHHMISQVDYSGDIAPVIILRSSECRIMFGKGDRRGKIKRLAAVAGNLDKLGVHRIDLRFGRSLVVKNKHQDGV